jgi:hypothetical protein
MGRGIGTTDRILRLLAELGPMTRAEIERELGPHAKNVSSLVSLLCQVRPANPRRAHISGWVFDMENKQRYPRAVYALGDLPNVKRPKPKTRAEVLRRYRAKRKAKYQFNSIFNIARSPDGLPKVRVRKAANP